MLTVFCSSIFKNTNQVCKRDRRTNSEPIISAVALYQVGETGDVNGDISRVARTNWWILPLDRGGRVANQKFV